MAQESYSIWQLSTSMPAQLVQIHLLNADYSRIIPVLHEAADMEALRSRNIQEVYQAQSPFLSESVEQSGHLVVSYMIPPLIQLYHFTRIVT
ncbi:hypothetical protein [Viridibacillus arvi]|uniref:hypothetical protein n=1 Tax=Viridibacillus arvi TaxID=263475 RepID=UPI003D053D00